MNLEIFSTPKHFRERERGPMAWTICEGVERLDGIESHPFREMLDQETLRSKSGIDRPFGNKKRESCDTRPPSIPHPDFARAEECRCLAIRAPPTDFLLGPVMALQEPSRSKARTEGGTPRRHPGEGKDKEGCGIHTRGMDMAGDQSRGNQFQAKEQHNSWPLTLEVACTNHALDPTTLTEAEQRAIYALEEAIQTGKD